MFRRSNRPRAAEPEKRSGPIPDGHHGLHYVDFVAELAARRNTRAYLEVGVHLGDLFSRIRCDKALGVDLSYMIRNNVMDGKRQAHLFQMTSDAFFAEHDARAILGEPIQLAFLDGLHHAEVLLRDFINAEAASSPDGMIVLHDCLPLTAEMTDRDWEKPRHHPVFKAYWTGDVWKLIPVLKAYRPDLVVTLTDCWPTGLAVVTHLDPASGVLRESYDRIAAEMDRAPSTEEALAAFYAATPVVPAATMLGRPDPVRAGTA